MFDKMNFMSVMDIVQLLSRARSSFSGIFGHKEGATKPTPSSEVKGDENIPTGLISEKFTKVDESHWQALMTHLGAGVSGTVRKIIMEMKRRDDADHGSRVDSFRIGVLLIPYKETEETVTRKVPKADTPAEVSDASDVQQQRRRQEKKPEKGAEETITRKSDPRFTDKDSRALYLKYLNDLVQSEMVGGKDESAAIAAVIDYLEADGFLTTGEMIQKAKKFAENTGNAAFEEVLRFRLGAEYDDIKNRHPRASAKQLRELRLCALRVRENYRTQVLRSGTRKELAKRDWLVIVGLIIMILVLVVSGLIYGSIKHSAGG